ncbi:hypothetical protein BSK71_02080 [Pectobacterium actinidiae]|uniref:Uncharacterized protein n=1 Tax=Pectobacterium actinidiae TaxID=1507808 RepID=A0A1V2R9L3_9GAMM|nr:hypothetical protein [Pectobacterium actinidiae]ONK07044.1 hypothetical protein BSK69_00795 [Pectobacterium actinidiae]ONK09041.1 hypothetical protein BSK71_02080 [Pectobacterium actinidiae]
MQKNESKYFSLKRFIFFVLGTMGVIIFCCMLSIPVGYIAAFIQTGSFNFNLEPAIDGIRFSIKVGGGVGAVLGIGLYFFEYFGALKKGGE